MEVKATTTTFEKSSVITGHHVYKYVWSPYIGEALSVEQEKDNQYDKYAVSVKKSGEIVGHVPRSFSKVLWLFLSHGGQINCKVTGKRKKGNGLEVPCVYFYTGPPRLIKKLIRLLSE